MPERFDADGVSLNSKRGVLQAHTDVFEALRKGQIDPTEAKAFASLLKQAGDLIIAGKPQRRAAPAGAKEAAPKKGRKDVEDVPEQPVGVTPHGPLGKSGKGLPSPKDPWAEPGGRQ